MKEFASAQTRDSPAFYFNHPPLPYLSLCTVPFLVSSRPTARDMNLPTKIMRLHWNCHERCRVSTTTKGSGSTTAERFCEATSWLFMPRHEGWIFWLRYIGREVGDRIWRRRATVSIRLILHLFCEGQVGILPTIQFTVLDHLSCRYTSSNP